MKPGIATSLSIAGVLVAGSAALALNSTVLQASSTVRGTPALAAVAPAIADSGAVTPLGQVSAAAVADAIIATNSPKAKKSDAERNDTIESITPMSSTTPSDLSSSVPSTLHTTPFSAEPVDKVFQVENFATITVTVSGRFLSVKSVVFAAGSLFKVTNQSDDDYANANEDHVRVVMASPSRTVVFSARLMNGQVVAAISDPSSANLPPRFDRDDDDDHDNDDDHEDREFGDHEERENDDD